MAEKKLTDLPRDLRLLYQKGNDAVLRENYDYAIELYNQVLDKEPGLFDGRLALRNAQIKKAGSGRGFFKKVLSSASTSPLVAKGQLTVHKNPAEALSIAEQILNHDPQSSAGHKLIVEAANALELPRTAAMSLEVLARNSPKDKDIAVQFAKALAAIGEGARAEKFLSDFVASLPYDNELQQALKDLSANKTLDEKGYQAVATGQGSYRDILKDKQEAVSLEQEKRVQKSEDVTDKLIREYEEDLKREPDNLKRLRSLAELYTQKKQFERALEYYNRVKTSEVGRNDPTLDKAVAETMVRQYDHRIEQLDKAAPDYAESAARLGQEKLAFQVGECQKLVEKFPTDLAIRFDMGSLYFQSGKIGEAIQEFQKAQGNPHKRIAAMNYLGQCYAKRKMYDLAARALQNAIKDKPVFDDEKKDLVYNLGSVLEGMGKRDEAMEQFKQIYEVDATFKDVGPRVEAFYTGQ
jgi:tetratricopeptide (TPR) repeat protein